VSREERTGERELAFSGWHRSLSDDCTVIDVDFAEYCNRCKRILAVIETAHGHHGTVKPTTVLRSLARQAGVSAYLILYDCDPAGEHGLAATMRVQRVYPRPSVMKVLSIGEVGALIERIHSAHTCSHEV
jgi:hypothetical protein